MMVSDEEKRWLVVGIAMNKVAVPVLRDFIKQGMDTHYANLDAYCSGLTTPCTLKTLTYHHVSAYASFTHMHFQNVNNNHLHGKHKTLYNYNINSSVDLAKLFLPDYLAEFAAFDELLNMNTILCLLGFNNPEPIFHSPNPSISIQTSADDVRENVRNKWGHCNVTDWTEVLFNDCFSKLETMVKSLGLTGGMEETTLDQLSDWQTKGRHLVMGHAVDHSLLSYVQQELKELIEDYTKFDSMFAMNSKRLPEVQETVLQDQPLCKRAKLEGHDEHLNAGEKKLQKSEEITKEEIEVIVERLVSIEKILSESLALTNIKVKEMERGFAQTDEKLEHGFTKTEDKVEQLEHGFTKTDDRLERPEHGLPKIDDKVEQPERAFTKTAGTVEQLEQDVLNKTTKEYKSGDSAVETFNVETFQRKLAEHYQKTAKVPTTVASSTCQVDFHQIYTRLSWVKDEQTSSGSSQDEQSHYSSIFSEKTQNGAVPKRILVQGETGIGKTTFVKKLLVDWSNLVDAEIKEAKKEEDTLKKFNDEEFTSRKDDEDKVEDSKESSSDDKDSEGNSGNGAMMDEIQGDALNMVNGDDVEIGKGDGDIVEETEESRIDDESRQGDEDISEDTEESCTDDESRQSDEDVLEDTDESNADNKDLDEDSQDDAKMDEEQKDALRKFKLLVAVNLKEVSECQTLKEVVSGSHLFPMEEESSVDDLLCYIYKNQDKVLLVLDGYDEYRTGSNTKVQCGSRINSPIYNIFHGTDLTDCTILVTTRSSRADVLQGSADVQVKITGFNISERKAFMRKMLDSGTQLNDLLSFIEANNLDDLARVPLMTHFFCLLEKEEKKRIEFAKRTTKLYQAIMEHILQYGHRKHSASQVSKLNEDYYEEILAEIGKVALAGLLKGDLVFKYGQLPEKVRSEESVIVGLFQVSKYAQSLESMEMIPLIRDYLVAWYVTFRCVPDGNFGGIEQYARTLEDCLSLTNVFQFICGLSDDGAVKVFQHLTSVRMSDPTLDFSKTTSDVEDETDVPMCDVTERHEMFSAMVLDSFFEVQSRNELFRLCLDCTCGIVIVCPGQPLSEWMPEVKDLTREVHSDIFVFVEEDSESNCYETPRSLLHKSLEFLECLDVPLKITEYSEVLRAEDFLERFLNSQCVECSFRCFLRFRNGQCQLFITNLDLHCDDHARLFTETTATSDPSFSASLLSEKSCLTFLKSLTCSINSRKILKDLRAIVRDCKYLKEIELYDNNDCVCDLLKQMLNSSTGSLKTGLVSLSIHGRITTEAVELATLLPKFNVKRLCLDLNDCSAAALTTLLSCITHKTLEVLRLRFIILTPAAAVTLGRALPEMSSLQDLQLIGRQGDIRQDGHIEALFGAFNKKLPLQELKFVDFDMKGSLRPLIKSLRFFPELESLHLGSDGTDMNDRDWHDLLESFTSIPLLKKLHLLPPPRNAGKSLIEYIDNLPKLESLNMHVLDCTEEDLSYVREKLTQKRPQLCLKFDGTV